MPAVKTKFHTKLIYLSSSKLSKAAAMISPMFALQDQMPISRPFLCPENQMLNIPMIPGQPVAWKKPFIHIRIVINTTL